MDGRRGAAKGRHSMRGGRKRDLETAASSLGLRLGERLGNAEAREIWQEQDLERLRQLDWDAGAESCAQRGIVAGAALLTLAINVCACNYFNCFTSVRLESQIHNLLPPRVAFSIYK